MRYLTELICNLYRLTDHHKLTTATFKNLADIKLFKPTADADTILQLENIFSEYSLRYIDRDLAEILSNLITTDKKHSLDFDFNKIQSLTDSKSFGCGWSKVINGSWFGTVAKLAMRQPFVLFKGLTFQKLCLPGAFRPGDHHNKMLRPGLCVVHASPQYL